MTSRFHRVQALRLSAAVGVLLAAAQLAAPALAKPPFHDLRRQGALGVQLGPDGPAPEVSQVHPHLTAARMGVKAGDVIRAVNGTNVSSPSELPGRLQGVRAGDPIILEVERDGVRKILRGSASEKPRERYQGADVSYGAVPFGGGYLRDILVTPTAAANAPIVFLLQGFTCASIEDETYVRLAAALAGHGIGLYRVEKSRVGDSVGGPDCATMDFDAELDGFKAAYEHLRTAREVPADRIFLLGHSLGGLQAPFLAAEVPPRGVAVFGTVLRNWADYYHAAAAFQSFLYANEDPVAAYEAGQRSRDVIDRFFFDRQSPSSIVAQDPSLEPLVREMLGWQGGDIATGGRHYRFLQSLASVSLPPAWKDTKSQVLSLYGQSDLVALFDTDHKLIAEIVNHYRPGTARYVSLPNTDHDMRLVTDRRSFRSVTAAKGAPPKGPFNGHVASVLVRWIEDSLSRPPVRCSGQASPAPGCAEDLR